MHYSKKDIQEALIQVGVKRGDTIFSHSNLIRFGRMSDAKDMSQYPQIFLDVILDIIGSEGNLVVPSFSYSFCNGQPYDKLTTPAPQMGIFAECVRMHPDAIRSYDANFSMSVIGNNSRELTENVPEHSFGENSIWQRLLESEGKIVNLNRDSNSTFIHFVEKKLQVPYRYDKVFNGKSLINSKWEDRRFYHYVRHLDKPEWDNDPVKFDREAKSRNLTRCASIGRGAVLSITLKDMHDLIVQLTDKNPYALTKGNEHGQD